MDRPKRKHTLPVRYSPSGASPCTSSRKRSRVIKEEIVSGDLLADGSLFLCEKCGSRFLDSRRRGPARKTTKVVHPTLRYGPHGEELLYCCRCGVDHDKSYSITNADTTKSKKSSQKSQPDEELVEFSHNLETVTGMPNASKLICYNTSRSCQCLPTYLKNAEDTNSEVQSLLDIMAEGERLRSLKVNNMPAGTRNRNIGLGNGKKRSKLYEAYVLQHRPRLREELQLCESTAQKILGYSNNFLHKSLITEEKRTRLGGKKKDQLQPVTMLWKNECCRDNCTRIVKTHLNLVARWRQLALESRRGLQQAVAELLTPTAGTKANCYKFIAMVTGCSTATIAKVVGNTRKNGGVLGMHEHGLRKYWRRKREIENGEDSEEELPSVWTLPQHHAEEVSLRQTVDKQRQELDQLKSLLLEKEKKIDEQHSELSAFNKKGATISGVKPPPLMLQSPTSGGWRSDVTNRLTVDTTSIPSPQYPHRHTTKTLLQPSKLDSIIKQRKETEPPSLSTVTATAKNSLIAQSSQDVPQPMLQAMQYYYGNNLEMAANMLSKPDSLYMSQTVAPGEHMHNLSSAMTYSQDLLTHMPSACTTMESAQTSGHYHSQFPSDTTHSQFHYL
ncbi:uncharacterized protein [Watersipora subatra]|uniref:uncharacterized protein n=1 Tax=Watersipora subatra TaxID=2589382 RepID=UPI00355C348B